jgi:hypothetical protein
MNAIRMLLENFKAGIREQGIKRAIRHDYHAAAMLDHPEELT